MTSKILLAFFVCMIAVAVESTYEESRDDSSDEEKCDFQSCENDKKCHECCDHNLHVDYRQAKKEYDALRVVVDDHCACYNYVLEKFYGQNN